MPQPVSGSQNTGAVLDPVLLGIFISHLEDEVESYLLNAQMTVIQEGLPEYFKEGHKF